MENKQFGRWLVLSRVKSPIGPSQNFKHYLCRCACGTESIVRGDTMRSGRSSQCRTCHDKQLYIDIQDMIGKTYGKWTVVRLAETENQRRVICVCICNKEFIIQASRLKIGTTQQCRKCNLTKHGYEGSLTYNTWRCMIARCTNPANHNYKYYAERGIKVCESWRTFANFLKDMGEKPKGLQLDRINNDGNYEPGNCRWTTAKENSNNRRKRPILWNKKPDSSSNLSIFL